MIKFRGDRQIAIYKPTKTSVSSSGAPVMNDVLVVSTWADVKEFGGSEKKEQNRTTAKATTNFTIRYESGITADMYIDYNSFRYDIIGVNEIERNQFLEIITERKEALNG